jgi:hypothetical protein
MRAGVIYGLALGVTLVFLDKIGSPVLSAVFWAAVTVQLAVAARLTWNRTGLWSSTFGMVHAAVTCAAFVPVHLAGYTMKTIPFGWQLVVAANALTIALTWFISTRENPDKWQRWKAVTENVSILDTLRFRHIPHLR